MYIWGCLSLNRNLAGLVAYLSLEHERNCTHKHTSVYRLYVLVCMYRCHASTLPKHIQAYTFFLFSRILNYNFTLSNPFNGILRRFCFPAPFFLFGICHLYCAQFRLIPSLSPETFSFSLNCLFFYFTLKQLLFTFSFCWKQEALTGGNRKYESCKRARIHNILAWRYHVRQCHHTLSCISENNAKGLIQECWMSYVG